MRLNYDTEADALDVRIAEGIVARTEEIETGTLVDLDEHGRLLSIEVIRPARRWPLELILSRYDVAQSDAEVLRRIHGTPVKFTLEETEPFALA